MALDVTNRYRSRILREMNANRENPFNSPPSSTGSHGTVSPTLSSVFSDPDGESTRRLNEDMKRVTAPSKKLNVNWDVLHRKWPEYYGPLKGNDVAVHEDKVISRPLSSESKENKAPYTEASLYDDSTHNAWRDSKRSRAEMQARVESESDMSSILAKSPNLAHRHGSNKPKNAAAGQGLQQRRTSLSEAFDRLRQSSISPKFNNRDADDARNASPHMSSAKSSLTAVQNSPRSVIGQEHDASHVRSFFMPDISHLGDFVTGTLRFNGSVKNGVPILVKHGKVHDRRERSIVNAHAQIDGLEIPADEEKIFVSMDMIREEIISLQDHYDKVQDYAAQLQQQVESLESELRIQRNGPASTATGQANERLIAQNDDLKIEVSTLHGKLEQAARKASLDQIEYDSVSQERDRVSRKLQEACEDINKLTRKLGSREKELESSNKLLGSTEQVRYDNDSLRRDNISLKHSRDALEIENGSLQHDLDILRQQQKEFQDEIAALRLENDVLRSQNEPLESEHKTLRGRNKTMAARHEELRERLDSIQQELDDVREEKDMLEQDNSGLVRQNEKYFNENKTLKHEQSAFERTMNGLQDQNAKLRDEVRVLKNKLGYENVGPNEGISVKLNEETENMTSAFFLPDITINTNTSEDVDETETKDLRPPLELTAQSTRLADAPDDEDTQTKTLDQLGRRSDNHQRSKSQSMVSARGTSGQHKVAFALPGQELPKSRSLANVANKGSKRREVMRHGQNELDDNTTEPQAVDDAMHSQRIKGQFKEPERARSRESLPQGTRSSRNRSQSRGSQRTATMTTDLTINSIGQKDACPALSVDARRVLDKLCDHSCSNCIVCTRITSHRGVLASADMISGKKRVTITRPVPVTDRNLSIGPDDTMRPAQSPGRALALVIKGLEDEARHLQLGLTRLHARYSECDKSTGRRARLALAEEISTLLKQLEVKNDQVYALYDVLEGQKAAGQEMTDVEVEMTVLSITGMTVQDVTFAAANEQVTWEGLPDV